MQQVPKNFKENFCCKTKSCRGCSYSDCLIFLLLFPGMKTLKTLHGKITLPTFFPDGTKAVVKGVDSTDLVNAGVEGLVINTYHLLVNSLGEKMEKFGGVHNFMNWPNPVITDSGGFQVMSLVHDHPGMGKIDDNGITFKWDPSTSSTPLTTSSLRISGQKVVLTPEKSIELQLKLDTDIAIVLDDCTRPDQASKDQEKSVERTIAWAKRSKDEFEKLVKTKRPLLFAVVQGGNNKKLRKKCAEALIEIGFDGYCYGGFPVDNKGKFMTGILEYVAKLLPDDKPKYALGIGRPENIIACAKMGYGIFDCVIPTREARHGKLYIWKGKSHGSIYIKSGKFAADSNPISQLCDCLTCKNYSRGYIHHLFKIGDTLSVRLATIHNLRFYSQLMERLK